MSLPIAFTALSGLISLIIFIPQMVLIFRSRSSIGVSHWLLYIRILGNILVYMASIQKKLDTVIIVMSLYTIIIDSLTIVVIFIHMTDDSEISLECLVLGITGIIIYVINYIIDDTVADIIAWAATVMFALSAIPQIVLNYEMGVSENFSIFTFMLRDFSILFYLLGLWFTITSWNDFFIKIQWIVGCTLNLLLDCVIYIQYYYKDRLRYQQV